MTSTIGAARRTIPTLVLRIPGHRASAHRTRGRHHRRGRRTVRSVAHWHATADGMVLADDQVDHKDDDKADDACEQGRDDQKDDPDGRVHASGLRVAVHPQRAEDEGDDADQTEAEGEYEPLDSHDLERARHRFARGTALTLFHHCSTSPGWRLTPSRTSPSASSCPCSHR